LPLQSILSSRARVVPVPSVMASASGPRRPPPCHSGPGGGSRGGVEASARRWWILRLCGGCAVLDEIPPLGRFAPSVGMTERDGSSAGAMTLQSILPSPGGSAHPPLSSRGSVVLTHPCHPEGAWCSPTPVVPRERGAHRPLCRAEGAWCSPTPLSCRGSVVLTHPCHPEGVSGANESRDLMGERGIPTSSSACFRPHRVPVCFGPAAPGGA